MRWHILRDPIALCDAAASAAKRRLRLRQLRGTVASRLQSGHIDSLELLTLLRARPPAVIYDIGANIGTWTLLAKAIFPGAIIHAFEPLRKHAATFLADTASLPYVHLHEVALGRAAENLPMQLTTLSDASSFLRGTATLKELYGIGAAGEQYVPVVRLDDFRHDHQLPAVDLLKIDVQGYEIDVLSGAPNTLMNARAVLVELSFIEIYEKQSLASDVIAFLTHAGYRLHAFGENTPVSKPLHQADALFVRETTLP